MRAAMRQTWPTRVTVRTPILAKMRGQALQKLSEDRRNTLIQPTSPTRNYTMYLSSCRRCRHRAPNTGQAQHQARRGEACGK